MIDYVSIIYDEKVIDGTRISENENKVKKLDPMCYVIRSQIYSIGYLDGRAGIDRSKEEIDSIINKVSKKYGWCKSSDEYNWIVGHYYNGLGYYNESMELYNNGLIDNNPEIELCYHYLMEREDLDEDIKNILKGYLDYEYEMNQYLKSKHR